MELKRKYPHASGARTGGPHGHDRDYYSGMPRSITYYSPRTCDKFSRKPKACAFALIAKIWYSTNVELKVSSTFLIQQDVVVVNCLYIVFVCFTNKDVEDFINLTSADFIWVWS